MRKTKISVGVAEGGLQIAWAAFAGGRFDTAGGVTRHGGRRAIERIGR